MRRVDSARRLVRPGPTLLKPPPPWPRPRPLSRFMPASPSSRSFRPVTGPSGVSRCRPTTARASCRPFGPVLVHKSMQSTSSVLRGGSRANSNTAQVSLSYVTVPATLCASFLRADVNYPCRSSSLSAPGRKRSSRRTRFASCSLLSVRAGKSSAAMVLESLL